MTASPQAPMPETREITVHDSFADVAEADWMRLLPGEAESWRYYRTAETVAPDVFRLGVMVVREAGQVIAVAPLFRVDYRLDTPLQGRARRVTNWLYARMPRLVSLPVLGIGSPLSDNCHIGIEEGLGEDQKRAILDAMIVALRRLAAKERSGLITLKSLTTEQARLFEPILARHGMQQVTSVPVVRLNLPFRSLDHYYSSLPEKTASYLKRKMRPAQKLRIEYRDHVGDLENQVFDMHQATLAQSKVDYGEFEQIKPGYFTRIVEELGDKARFMLCWEGDTLLSFQLFVVGKNEVIAKKIGMRYPQARDYNLYFVNFIKMIEFAIEHRKASIEMGATTYATKLLFGGYLERRWLHYRFRWDLFNWLLRPFGKAFDFERNDPELQALNAPKPPAAPPKAPAPAKPQKPAAKAARSATEGGPSRAQAPAARTGGSSPGRGAAGT